MLPQFLRVALRFRNAADGLAGRCNPISEHINVKVAMIILIKQLVIIHPGFEPE